MSKNDFLLKKRKISVSINQTAIFHYNCVKIALQSMTLNLLF